MSGEVRVMLVEDDPMAARHLSAIVEREENLRLVRVIESAMSAEIFCLKEQIGLVLMDVCTAMNASGIDAAIKIKKSMPEIKLIIMTSQLDADLIDRARVGGVDSFGYKFMTDDGILNLIASTLRGESVYPDSLPVVKLGSVLSSEIDRQHMNVLRELADGLTDDEIAEKLHLSVNTVKKYVSQLLMLTEFRNRTELAVNAGRLGLVTPGY
jgi:DNA-binding NarL/FixJ family response regulator